jgi:hypothetical protein
VKEDAVPSDSMQDSIGAAACTILRSFDGGFYGWIADIRGIFNGLTRLMPGETARAGAGVGAWGAQIVECKIAAKILPIHEMQLVNYLKASTITVGLILNFGPEPAIRRLVLSFPRGKAALIRC